MKPFTKSLTFLLSALAVSASLHAETTELRLAKQPGLVYLPTIIMEENKLIEKHAKALGLNDLTVSWRAFNAGASFNDSLIAGNIDIAVAGTTNLILLWSKTNGAIKGYAGVGATPMILVTRNPNIKTLADFTADDKIAVPTVKLSTQAIVLQIAAENQFGPGGRDRINALTVSMGHPDAMIALQNKSEQITSHFSLPPYQWLELKMPGVREILSSVTVMGGPVSNAVAFGPVKFHDQNPKVVAAFNAALDEALALVEKDKAAAAEVYLRATKEKTTVAELVAQLNMPNMLYSKTPLGVSKTAAFFGRAGYIKTAPADWKELFFPEVAKLPGN